MKKSKKIEAMDIIIFLIVFVIFGVALLSFFPAIMTSDCVDQMNQAATGVYRTSHPVIHTFILGNLAKLGGVWVPALFQILVFSFIWTYECKVLRKYNNSNKNKIFQIIFTVVICVFPLNFMYSITLWKDILYSYLMLLLLIFIVIGTREKYQYSTLQIILISLSSVGVMQFRYNGKPIGLIMFLILFIFNLIHGKRLKRKILKPILTFIISFIMIYAIASIPGKIYIHQNTTSSGISGIFNPTKIYCMGALLNTDINFDSEDIEFLNHIMDTTYWKEEYNPGDGNALFFRKKNR